MAHIGTHSYATKVLIMSMAPLMRNSRLTIFFLARFT